MIQRHNAEYTLSIIMETDTEHVMIAERITEQQREETVKLGAPPSQVPVITKIRVWGLAFEQV